MRLGAEFCILVGFCAMLTKGNFVQKYERDVSCIIEAAENLLDVLELLKTQKEFKMYMRGTVVIVNVINEISNSMQKEITTQLEISGATTEEVVACLRSTKVYIDAFSKHVFNKMGQCTNGFNKVFFELLSQFTQLCVKFSACTVYDQTHRVLKTVIYDFKKQLKEVPTSCKFDHNREACLMIKVLDARVRLSYINLQARDLDVTMDKLMQDEVIKLKHCTEGEPLRLLRAEKHRLTSIADKCLIKI